MSLKNFKSRVYIFVCSLIIGLSGIAHAQERKMDVASLNGIIEQTNFIVNSGCSGTLIDLEKRLILTNHHCIDSLISTVEEEKVDSSGLVSKVKTRRIKDVLVEQHGYDGFTKVSTLSFFAEIVADNKKVDLALLRVKSPIPNKYASPIISDGDARRGEDVFAVGNPGSMDATVVKGIVSNVNRTFEFPWTGGSKLPMVQFSGGIYGGNSGGALYNDYGQLVGVPAAGFTAANFIGLAIPASIIRNFLKENCYEETYSKAEGANAKCVAEKKDKEKDKKKE